MSNVRDMGKDCDLDLIRQCDVGCAERSMYDDARGPFPGRKPLFEELFEFSLLCHCSYYNRTLFVRSFALILLLLLLLLLHTPI